MNDHGGGCLFFGTPFIVSWGRKYLERKRNKCTIIAKPTDGSQHKTNVNNC